MYSWISGLSLLIYSVFTKDTLDEKGQARDTRVHVTLMLLNVYKRQVDEKGQARDTRVHVTL